MEREFTAVIWREKELFVSLCPQLDVSSFGRTQKEALENLKDAVELYVQEEPEFKPMLSRKNPVLKSFKVAV